MAYSEFVLTKKRASNLYTLRRVIEKKKTKTKKRNMKCSKSDSIARHPTNKPYGVENGNYHRINMAVLRTKPNRNFNSLIVPKTSTCKWNERTLKRKKNGYE